MKNKNIFLLALLCMIASLFSSCSNDEEIENTPVSKDGQFTYSLYLDCGSPTFEDITTRATTAWANGEKVYMRFKNGTSWVSGTAVYSSSTGKWAFSTNTALSTASTSTTCTAYFFQNVTSSTSSQVNLSERSVIFYGQGSYTHPNSSDIYVSVTLDPYTWRMRFSGTSGSTLTLESTSDVYFYSAFNCTTGELTSGKKSVSLTVGSNGYTPYVYGAFSYISGDNTIKVTAGGHTFYRTVKGTALKAKAGAYLVLPNMNNYIENGWRKESKYVANCDVRTSYPVAFTDALVTGWSVGSNVALCWIRVYKLSEIASLSNDEIIIKMTKSGIIETKESIDDYICEYSDLSTNTEYVLCTYCTDINGDHGNLVKYQFRTLSTSAPQAEITDARYSSTQHSCTIARRNSASSFYLVCYQGSNVISWSEHFVAWYVRKQISTGEISSSNIKYSFTTYYFSKSSNYVTFCTWARNSSGTMGNYDVFQGVASARKAKPACGITDGCTKIPKSLEAELKKSLSVFSVNE